MNVDASMAIKYGWPECCGYTMTIDSPEERAELNKARNDTRAELDK